ncbi:LOW QUALITY PROTEIN: LTR-Retrotransposon skipper [Phytophthora megakarya]|uniref:LTR-Retrotransposon skipper n=1 Tax=Phytophthora megakarya TaxID=4795 RepID=A0A225VAD3_9STRA|nr:LOW QUALITY PROTEIN: LTR-Retrotransposon skipper [Phytophthora megakarya]
MDASIDVSDAIPVHRKQFLFSKVQREAILKWTQEMLKARLIRPSSPPDCAPTFCVREWRIVHDFRRLNTKVRVPAKPIPGKDEILRAMANARIFSAIDLLWNFFQGKLREDSIPYTTFSTPDGLFKYPVTPMGISSSPACFHRLVQPIFNDYDSFCRTYFDNLFIFIPSDSDFHVCVNASDFAVGGYIFQYDDAGQERIITFGGRKLTQPELIYPTRKKELLAALHAMRAWKVYLLYKPFYLNTAHRMIESLLQQQTCSQRLARWLNGLALFQPRFKWIAGSTNITADSTSRLDGRRKSRYYGSRRLRRFGIDQGLLYFQVRPDAPRRLCISNVAGLHNSIIFEEHDAPVCGHPGQAKTLLFLLEKIYWRGMTQSVERYVSFCKLYQRNKCIHGRPADLLHPQEIPDQRWTGISIVFMIQLPRTTSGYDAGMVIVDRLTKRGHFVATQTYATAAGPALLFRNEYQRLHGLPTTIVSDRDPKFTSLWKEIMKLQSTTL